MKSTCSVFDLLKLSTIFIIHVHICACCTPGLITNKQLLGSTFLKIENSWLYSCAADCVSHAVCRSFNFDQLHRRCYLNYETAVNSSNTDAANFVYSDIKQWENIPLGPCQRHQCGAGQRCRVNRLKTSSCENATINLSHGRPATASSKFPHSPAAQVVVDGSSKSYWYERSCYHTAKKDPSPWWQVDLLNSNIIIDVRILNRGDVCCYERLHDIVVNVYKGDPDMKPDAISTLCNLYTGPATEPGGTVVFNCTTPVIGRYVRVTKTKEAEVGEAMQLCEVEVFGFPSI